MSKRRDILDTLRGNVGHVLDLLLYSFCVTGEIVVINTVVNKEALNSIIRIPGKILVGLESLTNIEISYSRIFVVLYIAGSFVKSSF